MSKQKINAKILCITVNFLEISFCLYFTINANVIGKPVKNIHQQSAIKQHMVIIKPCGRVSIANPRTKIKI